MSEAIKHECGIVLMRLLKPLEYYVEKYSTSQFGLNSLYLLMEKQHNRGQEGAGIACVNLNALAGEEYIFRERAVGNTAITELFKHIADQIESYNRLPKDERSTSAPFTGELYLGHLRYSTTGHTGMSYLHPFLRRNNWRSRNLCLAGNFNLTNVDEVFDYIVADGQHPRHNADAFIILEQLGSLLDNEINGLYRKFALAGKKGQELNVEIEQHLDLEKIIRHATALWDGGFVIGGLTGSGDAFVFRDKWGIRPAFYFANDEIVVVTSERPVIQTVFDVQTDEINELKAGEGLFIKQDGSYKVSQIHKAEKVTPCSFERIYFSRGSDRDIYQERKTLGRLLTPQILHAIDNDLNHTVFSFIPNTAEVAYYGMMEGVETYLDTQKTNALLNKNALSETEITTILSQKIRTEKLAIKDIKLRTFITEGTDRNDLAAHVYDVTYGVVNRNEDTIVVIDDSIVRGTTLKQSIIKILSRLNPKKIVIVSSSPQIRYPDCYGIDMSSMNEFIAFNAAIELLKERGMQHIIDEVYKKSEAQALQPKEWIVNYVKEIYAPFTDVEIAKKISQMVSPEGCTIEVEIIYQTIKNLHLACPKHNGDWYFSGNFPTPGGNKIVNCAFINYYEEQFNLI